MTVKEAAIYTRLSVSTLNRNDAARAVYAAAVKHRPCGCYTIRQRSRIPTRSGRLKFSSGDIVIRRSEVMLGAKNCLTHLQNRRGFELLQPGSSSSSALKSSEPDAAKARAYFERALTVAREQQAKSWELRAAMSIARLLRDQGKRDEARDLLAPVV
jgi:hypothetical protein